MNILITGAGGSIGTAIGQTLNKVAPTVGVIGLDDRDDLDTLSRVKYTRFFNVDAARWSLAGEELDVSAVVNAAGVPFIKRTAELTAADFRSVFDSNVFSAINVTNQVLPSIIRNKGMVINIISDAAYRPMRCSTLYNASKAALDMVTRCMAREWSDKPITVLGIAPNRVANTGMSRKVDYMVEKVRGWTPAQVQSHQAACLPRGETDVNDLASFIVKLLLSEIEGTRYLHGCIIPFGSSGF